MSNDSHMWQPISEDAVGDSDTVLCTLFCILKPSSPVQWSISCQCLVNIWSVFAALVNFCDTFAFTTSIS